MKNISEIVFLVLLVSIARVECAKQEKGYYWSDSPREGSFTSLVEVADQVVVLVGSYGASEGIISKVTFSSGWTVNHNSKIATSGATCSGFQVGKFSKSTLSEFVVISYTCGSQIYVSLYDHDVWTAVKAVSLSHGTLSTTPDVSMTFMQDRVAIGFNAGSTGLIVVLDQDLNEVLEITTSKHSIGAISSDDEDYRIYATGANDSTIPYLASFSTNALLSEKTITVSSSTLELVCLAVSSDEEISVIFKQTKNNSVEGYRFINTDSNFTEKSGYLSASSTSYSFGNCARLSQTQAVAFTSTTNQLATFYSSTDYSSGGFKSANTGSWKSEAKDIVLGSHGQNVYYAAGAVNGSTNYPAFYYVNLAESNGSFNSLDSLSPNSDFTLDTVAASSVDWAFATSNFSATITTQSATIGFETLTITTKEASTFGSLQDPNSNGNSASWIGASSNVFISYFLTSLYMVVPVCF
mmetsp:Transcript_10098/g.11022  ORF Transcript_10098/g.11022 Transcript_10098/m.11022 type:complete len:467 (+) Transcript_10098:36-1436(+)